VRDNYDTAYETYRNTNPLRTLTSRSPDYRRNLIGCALLRNPAYKQTDKQGGCVQHPRLRWWFRQPVE